LIADLLRTDRERFAPWRPDSELLTRIKTKLGHVDYMTKLTTSHTNRLRSILLRVYPQVLQAFNDVHVCLALHLLVAYPTAVTLARLSYADFAAFCRQQRCHRLDWITTWYSRLQQTQPSVQASMAAAYQDEIVFIAQQLLWLIQEKKQALQQVQVLYQQHPDHPIFASLPGAGDMLQPKLLVMLGEDRARFPSPQDIRALAGTCPSPNKVVSDGTFSSDAPVTMASAKQPSNMRSPPFNRWIGLQLTSPPLCRVACVKTTPTAV